MSEAELLLNNQNIVLSQVDNLIGTYTLFSTIILGAFTVFGTILILVAGFLVYNAFNLRKEATDIVKEMREHKINVEKYAAYQKKLFESSQKLAKKTTTKYNNMFSNAQKKGEEINSVARKAYAIQQEWENANQALSTASGTIQQNFPSARIDSEIPTLKISSSDDQGGTIPVIGAGQPPTTLEDLLGGIDTPDKKKR